MVGLTSRRRWRLGAWWCGELGSFRRSTSGGRSEMGTGRGKLTWQLCHGASCCIIKVGFETAGSQKSVSVRSMRVSCSSRAWWWWCRGLLWRVEGCRSLDRFQNPACGCRRLVDDEAGHPPQHSRGDKITLLVTHVTVMNFSPVAVAGTMGSAPSRFQTNRNHILAIHDSRFQNRTRHHQPRPLNNQTTKPNHTTINKPHNH